METSTMTMLCCTSEYHYPAIFKEREVSHRRLDKAASSDDFTLVNPTMKVPRERTVGVRRQERRICIQGVEVMSFAILPMNRVVSPVIVELIRTNEARLVLRKW